MSRVVPFVSLTSNFTVATPGDIVVSPAPLISSG
ncbi:hypothetical protein Golomagni_03654 [Golovinomyces magnicellulatus]|nr:hypothetical protein Golomagni_03654 [Golovinomyces magnicellulatus]